MKKTLSVFLLMTVLTLNACTPMAPATSTLLPRSEPATPVATQVPSPVSPTEANPSANQKPYANNTFGLSFQYPSNWFGPGEYVTGATCVLKLVMTKYIRMENRQRRPQT